VKPLRQRVEAPAVASKRVEHLQELVTQEALARNCLKKWHRGEDQPGCVLDIVVFQELRGNPNDEAGGIEAFVFQ